MAPQAEDVDVDVDVDPVLLTAKFKGQFDKDWTGPTILEQFLKTKEEPVKWMKTLLRDYEQGNISLSDIIGSIPSSGGWVHSALPQFNKHAGKECLLLFAFCPQYGEDVNLPEEVEDPTNSCFFDVIAGVVARSFDPTIVLSARKDCRKVKKLENGSKTYRRCYSIGPTESAHLWLATKLELAIAKKEYGIAFKGCAAFSSAAQDIGNALGIQLYDINDPSEIGRVYMHSSWLAFLGLRDLATQLAAIDGRDAESLYGTMRQAILKARPHWKEVP